MKKQILSTQYISMFFFIWMVIFFLSSNHVFAQSVRIQSPSIVNPVNLNQLVPYGTQNIQNNKAYPSLVNTSTLQVSKLQVLHIPENTDWEVSLTITDLGDERLFKNFSDFTNLNGTTLKLAPSRHFWFGIQRRFK